jgi:glycerophosphoryl diester phosphodiesterase
MPTGRTRETARKIPSVNEAGEYRALQGRPLTFAHRGGGGLWPENTLQAFRAAIDLGCSHLETDLRSSKDGEIVLFHDERLERTTNGTGSVSDFTLRELKELDAGYRFSPDGSTYPARGRGFEIPTFAELVAEAPGTCFNVEIKERGHPDLPRALWEFIQRHGIRDRIIVAAEKHRLVRDFRRLSGKQVATAASRRECLKFWLASGLGVTTALDIRYQALQIPVRVRDFRFLTPRLLEAARQRGIAVHVWTIDDPGEMHRLLEAGVDGLMTDFPDRLLAVIRQRER